MRLDHLLSKEHVHLALSTGDHGAKPFRGNPVLSGQHAPGGAHGWNIDIVTRTMTRQTSTAAVYSGKERFESDCLVFCTLLGPEGPGRLVPFRGRADADLWTDWRFHLRVGLPRTADFDPWRTTGT